MTEILTQMTRFSLQQKKTLWEKEENAGNQHFLPFPTMFLEAVCLGIFKGSLRQKASENIVAKGYDEYLYNTGKIEMNSD